VRCLTLNPKRAPTWAALGRLYASAGAGHLARRCFEAGRSHEPTATALWEGMGHLAARARWVDLGLSRDCQGCGALRAIWKACRCGRHNKPTTLRYPLLLTYCHMANPARSRGPGDAGHADALDAYEHAVGLGGGLESRLAYAAHAVSMGTGGQVRTYWVHAILQSHTERSAQIAFHLHQETPRSKVLLTLVPARRARSSRQRPRHCTSCRRCPLPTTCLAWLPRRAGTRATRRGRTKPAWRCWQSATAPRRRHLAKTTWRQRWPTWEWALAVVPPPPATLAHPRRSGGVTHKHTHTHTDRQADRQAPTAPAPTLPCTCPALPCLPCLCGLGGGGLGWVLLARCCRVAATPMRHGAAAAGARTRVGAGAGESLLADWPAAKFAAATSADP
jgi:hypothetical protein